MEKCVGGRGANAWRDGWCPGVRRRLRRAFGVARAEFSLAEGGGWQAEFQASARFSTPASSSDRNAWATAPRASPTHHSRSHGYSNVSADVFVGVSVRVTRAR